jgi:2-C-methyl-D-erythritol 4-phosphate cytidylyltransferase
MAEIRASAIITAAGLGRRFGEELPKQFVKLQGKPVLAHSLETFSKSDLIDEIVVVVPADRVEHTRSELVEKPGIQKVKRVIPGGAERQDSVKAGFDALSDKPDIVVVHDGVRPFVSRALLERVIREASAWGGAIAALPANDTIKKSTRDGFIETTVHRDSLWFAQTPQAFRYEILKDAILRASGEGFRGTDESIVVERTGAKVRLVRGSPYNIKITTPEDLRLGELILKEGLR